VEDEIGTAAGTIWQYLHGRGQTTTGKLNQETKLSYPLLFMGIGWLAREGKLNFARVQKSLRVSLKAP
jgi:hypothetical protein